MNITCNKFGVTTAVLVSCAVWVASAMGMHINFTVTYPVHPEGLAIGNGDRESIVLVQNDNSADEKNENSASSSGDKGSESEAASADDVKNKSSDAKSKPLKPFVPSEKIPGDQAVDFPVDI